MIANTVESENEHGNERMNMLNMLPITSILLPSRL